MKGCRNVFDVLELKNIYFTKRKQTNWATGRNFQILKERNDEVVCKVVDFFSGFFFATCWSVFNLQGCCLPEMQRAETFSGLICWKLQHSLQQGSLNPILKSFCPTTHRLCSVRLNRTLVRSPTKSAWFGEVWIELCCCNWFLEAPISCGTKDMIVHFLPCCLACWPNATWSLENQTHLLFLPCWQKECLKVEHKI